MSRRVAIGNNKGGSGKTTSCVQLAAALAETGLHVLVVDMDPQANATRRLGLRYDPANPVLTTSEVVASGEEGVAAQAIRPCGWPAPYDKLVSVIPSRFDLENRISEAAVIGANARLADALAGVDDDLITLIDLPPSLGHLTQLGLASVQVALCTVEPEYDAVDGALRFRDFVTRHGARLGQPELRIGGYIIGRVRPTLSAHAFQLEGLPEEFGVEQVWTPYVPERAAIKDAADTAIPLRNVPTTAAREVADIYAALAERLIKELDK